MTFSQWTIEVLQPKRHFPLITKKNMTGLQRNVKTKDQKLNGDITSMYVADVPSPIVCVTDEITKIHPFLRLS